MLLTVPIVVAAVLGCGQVGTVARSAFAERLPSHPHNYRRGHCARCVWGRMSQAYSKAGGVTRRRPTVTGCRTAL